MLDMLIWMGIFLLRILEALLVVLVVLVLGYVFVRVVAFAAAKSWFHVRGEFRGKGKAVSKPIAKEEDDGL